eukprot:scaffold12722_cov78-Skeletonema_dohrnii-CCMP3373.AAC.2
MSNYNGPLEAVDCHIQRVRYDMAVNLGLGSWRLAAVSDGLIRSPIRRRRDENTTNKYLSREKDASILSWPTIMGH